MPNSLVGFFQFQVSDSYRTVALEWDRYNKLYVYDDNPTVSMGSKQSRSRGILSSGSTSHKGKSKKSTAMAQSVGATATTAINKEESPPTPPSPSVQDVQMEDVNKSGPKPVVLDKFTDVRDYYHVDPKEVGHGHYGVVRKCRDKESKEWLAIKSILKSKVNVDKKYAFCCCLCYLYNCIIFCCLYR